MSYQSLKAQIQLDSVPSLEWGKRLVQDRQSRLSTLAGSRNRVFNLAYLIDYALLRVAGMSLRVDAAAGVDRVSPRTYRRDLSLNIIKLKQEVQNKTYQPLPARRVSIDKDDGSKRHLGLPSTRDKHLQRAVLILLEAIYEPNFHPHSYGFRPRRSAKMAMKVLRTWIQANHGAWVLEIDLSKFFDTIPHKRLLEVISERVGDQVVLKLLKLWLSAGVMVDGDLQTTDRGTQQGGVISPLEANVYLDKALDQWLTKTYFPELKGKAVFSRYADDFVIAFQDEHECRQALQDITTRLEEFGLTVNRLKTRITDMRPLAVGEAPKGIPPEITFLGFTLYWKPCPETGWELAVRTSDKSIKRFTERLHKWIGEYDAQGLEPPTALLAAKVRGHRDYFDVAGDVIPTTPEGARGNVPRLRSGTSLAHTSHNRQMDVRPGGHNTDCIQADLTVQDMKEPEI